MLSVLHIGTADNSGGAARAAYRLHNGFRAMGVTSRMLVRWKFTEDKDVRFISESPAVQYADKIFGKISEWAGFPYSFYPSSQRLSRLDWFREATVVQLHNLHGNFFAYPRLAEISRLKPVVWLLHDMWALTGHCAYAYDCEEWKKGCQECRCSLDEYPPLRWNTSSWLWRLKKNVFARSKLTIVSPSLWLSQCVKDSPLLGQFPVHTIPYGVDTSLYTPKSKREMRIELGLPQDARVLLFGSQSISDPRKGGGLLKEALRSISPETLKNWLVVTIGEGDARSLVPATIPVHSFGSIRDEERLARIYAASDVFVLPTLADNLPNTILESMSCGTPVVSFRTGGVPDAVRHLETGYLAQSKTADALAHALVEVLNNDALRLKLASRARCVAESEYDIRLISKRYLDLYGNL